MKRTFLGTVSGTVSRTVSGTYQHCQLSHQTSVDQLVLSLLHGRKASYKEQYGTGKNGTYAHTQHIRASSSEVCIGEYMYAIDELQHAHVKCYSSVRVIYLWSVHFVLTSSYLRAQGCGSGTCMNAQDTAHQ